MIDPIHIDAETCGLYGVATLIQYAIGEGEIQLFCPWTQPVEETLDLIKLFINHEDGIVFFNAAFDWFHLTKMYTVFEYWATKYNRFGEYPEDYIDEIAYCEEHGRFGPCLKPTKVIDLFLLARKTEYQTCMDRSDIKLKRIPTALAWELAKELDNRVQLKDIYFARKKDPTKRWKVMDIEDDMGDIVPEFKDILLKFAPSSGLKALAQDALGYEDNAIIHFTDVEPPESSKPRETGWAPFATAMIQDKKTKEWLTPNKGNNWCEKWPAIGKIKAHIRHWTYNSMARTYAADDIKYTRGMYHYFAAKEAGLSHKESRIYATGDAPKVHQLEFNDIDSTLACMVASVRWRGFKIDVGGMIDLRSKSIKHQRKSKYNFNSPDVCKGYLTQVLSDAETMVLKSNGKMSTSGILLELIAKSRESVVCDDCNGMGCHNCEEGEVMTDTPTESAKRAQEILDFRHAGKKIQVLNKLIAAGRFHASFKVIGTLSGRMAGGDGLNAQGIDHSPEFRELFTLADNGMTLSAGDYDGFEVTIMIEAYDDEKLRSDYLSTRPCHKCGGEGCPVCKQTGELQTKLYAIAGTMFFPGMSYDDIMNSKGMDHEKDKYDRSKKGTLALFYGGEGFTLASRVGISELIGDDAFQKWLKRYPEWSEARKAIHARFCSMSQPGGLGTAVEWGDPEDSAETLFGFRRFFTLENKICKALFQLGEKPPESWANIKTKVVRRDREQTACGASRSACFGAAFGIQGSCMRAAANHIIQGTGAHITKGLQCAIWDFQPVGINNWKVQPMNIHDEVTCCIAPELVGKVHQAVDVYNQKMKDTIPLIEMKWAPNLKSWADK